MRRTAIDARSGCVVRRVRKGAKCDWRVLKTPKAVVAAWRSVFHSEGGKNCDSRAA